MGTCSARRFGATCILGASLLACKGARVENGIYVGIHDSGKSVSYSKKNVWDDRSRKIDLEHGYLSPDFFRTKAKYEFLNAFFLGVTVEGGDSSKLVKGLKDIYGQAQLGDPIAIAQIDEIFELVLNDMYPKDNPVAQYNLGLVYSDLKQMDEAKKWYSMSAGQGFTPALQKLLELRD